MSNHSCSVFTPLNRSIGIGNIFGTNVLTYLDDITGKGRRVDLNMFPY